MPGKVGFIGLGNMGGPMALNLAKAGFSLVVHDIDPKKLDPLAAEGAAVETSPAQITEGKKSARPLRAAGAIRHHHFASNRSAKHCQTQMLCDSVRSCATARVTIFAHMLKMKNHERLQAAAE